ncbi:MAG TPA: hypothetical protein VFR14_01515 [Candidatus Limnocylindrales bacterium]|nr:hypothetical protein [Candidatus Limnocylindrales bacterium]
MTGPERSSGESPYGDDREVRIDVYRIGPTGTSGRGPVVVGGFLAVLVAVVGLAVFGGRSAEGDPASSAAAIASGDATTRPSRSPRPTPVPTPRPELPGLPNDHLPGAPLVVLGMQRGDDLELTAWETGTDAFAPVGRIPGVMARRSDEQPNQDGYTNIDLAPAWRPDGRPPLVAAVRFVYESDVSLRSWASIVGAEGPLWESGEAAFGLQTVWSADGTALAVGGTPVWSVVRVGPDGTVSTVEVRVAEDPGPQASGVPAFDPFSLRLPLPIGFSANGRWLFGAVYHDTAPSLRVAVRVDLAADPPVAEQIDRLPAGDAADRLVSTSYMADSFDPATGRMAEITYERDPPRLRVFEPGASDSLDPLDQDAGIQTATWLGNDELLLVAYRQDIRSDQVGSAEVLRYSLADRSGTYLAGAGRVNGAWVNGTQAGFALVMFWAEDQVEMVVLRTGDGATGSLQARQPEFMSIDLVSR